jgi:hypothetical protein
MGHEIVRVRGCRTCHVFAVVLVQVHEIRNVRPLPTAGMKKQESRQQAAEQISSLLIDSLAAREVREDDVPFVESFAQVNQPVALARDGSDGFGTDQLGDSVEGADRLRPNKPLFRMERLN